MRTRARICASLFLSAASVTLAAPASSQEFGMAGNAAVDALPPFQIMAIARSTGFDPISRPIRSGRTYVMRALDPYDVEVSLVVDARTGRLVSARQVAAPPYAARRGPMPGPYAAPVYGRIFGPPDDDDLGAPRPPRNLPNIQPPQAKPAAVKPAQDALKPAQDKVAERAPLPRPRPYVMEATSSIPLAADTPAAASTPVPQKDPEPPAQSAQKDDAAADDAAQDNGGAAMPPIPPL
ncbi:MAG TPA: hypothetical protein VGH49_18010 [Xanthobacteraceae bacterium]